MKIITPRLETLPQAQRNLWPLLGAIGSNFVLYGGTALSLQLGGRRSVDFDFFTAHPVDAESLKNQYSFLKKAKLIQRATATATFLLNCPEPVQISFFGTLNFGRVDNPIRFEDNGLIAAGLLDLAAQKAKVVQFRAETKDYLDICTLINNGISLEQALGSAKMLYPEFNPAITLQALTFFKDGDLQNLPENNRNKLISVVAKIRHIPTIPKKSNSILADAINLTITHSYPDFEALTKSIHTGEYKPNQNILETAKIANTPTAIEFLEAHRLFTQIKDEATNRGLQKDAAPPRD